MLLAKEIVVLFVLYAFIYSFYENKGDSLRIKYNLPWLEEIILTIRFTLSEIDIIHFPISIS